MRSILLLLILASLNIVIHAYGRSRRLQYTNKVTESTNGYQNAHRLHLQTSEGRRSDNNRESLMRLHAYPDNYQNNRVKSKSALFADPDEIDPGTEFMTNMTNVFNKIINQAKEVMIPKKDIFKSALKNIFPTLVAENEKEDDKKVTIHKRQLLDSYLPKPSVSSRTMTKAERDKQYVIDKLREIEQLKQKNEKMRKVAQTLKANESITESKAPTETKALTEPKAVAKIENVSSDTSPPLQKIGELMRSIMDNSSVVAKPSTDVPVQESVFSKLKSAVDTQLRYDSLIVSVYIL